MKNLLLFVVALFTVVSCTNKNQNTDQNVEAKVIFLTKKEFLKKVANYEMDSLEWNYLGDKPAIVDFYASWCNPCKVIAPILEELAREYEGQIYIYKIDVDKEKELAADFGIERLPTLLFIPLGSEPAVKSGIMTRSQFKEYIDNFLLKN